MDVFTVQKMSYIIGYEVSELFLLILTNNLVPGDIN
jgi:hypothetical protein